jgi:molybdenum cofactor cytidylyltransferase
MIGSHRVNNAVIATAGRNPTPMITGIILASGLSRRMGGQDKLLLPVDGIALVERVMQAADASWLDDIILAYQNPAVAELAGKYRIRTVHNPEAALGLSASVKAGVLAALPETQAYLFLTGDQPRLEAATINLLICDWQDHKDRILVPVYGGRRGSPVVFPARFRAQLLALEGDTGGRAVIEQAPEMVRCVDMPDADAGIDIDTPDEYEDSTRERKQ